VSIATQMTETVKPNLFLCSKCGHVFKARVNNGKAKRCNRCGSWQVSPTENAIEEMDGNPLFTDDDLDSKVQEIYNELHQGKPINDIINELSVPPSLAAFVTQFFILNQKLQKQLDGINSEMKPKQNQRQKKELKQPEHSIGEPMEIEIVE